MMKSLIKKVCSQCILDENDDPEITFDQNGICNYCISFNSNYINSDNFETKKKEELVRIVDLIKKDKKGKYDCIIGLSGGADSTYLVHLAVELGLNPLVVHYDNGWNSELAVKNIENVIKAIGVDFYSHVNDWNEIRSLQRSFIKASVIDIELINDQAILAILQRMAYKYKIKYYITGHNHSTEGILPYHWYHWKIDVGNITGINRKFENIKLKTYPMVTFFESWWRSKFSKLQQFCFLDYVDYNKEEVKKFLTEKYGWRDYGGKHYESVFTRFYQGYILPRKFNVDKRKAHLSTLICAGQISREQAMVEISNPEYSPALMKEDREFVIKKLGFSESEFDMYMKIPPVKHTDYPSYFHTYYKLLAFFGKDVAAFKQQ